MQEYIYEDDFVDPKGINMPNAHVIIKGDKAGPGNIYAGKLTIIGTMYGEGPAVVGGDIEVGEKSGAGFLLSVQGNITVVGKNTGTGELTARNGKVTVNGAQYEEKTQQKETLHFSDDVHFGKGGDTGRFGPNNVIKGETIFAASDFRLGDNNPPTSDPFGAGFMKNFDPTAGNPSDNKNSTKTTVIKNVVDSTSSIKAGGQATIGDTPTGDGVGGEPHGGTMSLGNGLTVNTTKAQIKRGKGFVSTENAFGTDNVTTIQGNEGRIEITGGDVVNGTLILGGTVRVIDAQGQSQELPKQGLGVDLSQHINLLIVAKYVNNQTSHSR